MCVANGREVEVEVDTATGEILLVIGADKYPLSASSAAQLARVITRKVPEARRANIQRMRREAA
jgi:predicted PP-loop superfamily ATPase